jgi:hypothetical protein
MGFRSGSVAYARFRVEGGPPHPGTELLEALAGGVLAAPPVGAPPEVQAGWTAGRHVLDRGFDAETILFGDHLLFGLRVDVNRVPEEIRRAYRALAETAMAPDAGGAARRAAREEADEQCRRELAEGRHRRSRLVPILWDVPGRLLLAPAFGDTVVAALGDLFTTTLDGRLVPLSSGAMARETLETTGRRRDYEDAAPSPFTAPPLGAARDESAARPRPGGSGAPIVPWAAPGPEPSDFLGNEFAIWLWERTETASAVIDVPGGGAVAVAIDRTLDMDCAWDVTGKQMLRASGPTRLPEAAAALRHGKWPRKLGLTLAAAGDQWELTLQADRFLVSGARLPKPEEAPSSAREHVEQRISSIAGLDRAIAGLFRSFLDQRFAGAWPSSRARMRDWIRDRGAPRAHAPVET